MRKEDEVTGKIIGAAIEVHRQLGPELLDPAYQACLAHEMELRGIQFEREKPLPIVYKGISLDQRYRLDFLVENLIIVELKSIKKLNEIHHAQTLSYLKVANLQLDLLLNFNVFQLKQGGIKRVANNL